MAMVATAKHTFSQIAHDYTFGLQVDLIKTNTADYFDRAQGGAEFNYYFSKKFTGTGGLEYWTSGNQLSAVLGARWYPINDAFIRFRGLIGANDLSFGAGWAKPLRDNWKFEAMGDFYFEGQIAIRAGIQYVVRRKSE